MAPLTRSSAPAAGKTGRPSKTSKSKEKKIKVSKVEDPITPFPFMRLPTEICNRIYIQVLVKRPSRCVGCGKYHGRKVNGRHMGTISLMTPKPGRPGQFEIAPPLLQVNKQIRKEAAAMYYGLNDLMIDIEQMHFCKFFAWVKVLGPLSKELRSITFFMDGYGGWLDWAEYGRIEEKHLSRACLVTAVGNYQMTSAFDGALTTMKHLRSCGLSWHQIRAAMINVRELVSAVGSTDPQDDQWAEYGMESMMSDMGGSDDDMPCPGEGDSDLDIDQTDL